VVCPVPPPNPDPFEGVLHAATLLSSFPSSPPSCPRTFMPWIFSQYSLVRVPFFPRSRFHFWWTVRSLLIPGPSSHFSRAFEDHPLSICRGALLLARNILCWMSRQAPSCPSLYHRGRPLTWLFFCLQLNRRAVADDPDSGNAVPLRLFIPF